MKKRFSFIHHLDALNIDDGDQSDGASPSPGTLLFFCHSRKGLFFSLCGYNKSVKFAGRRRIHGRDLTNECDDSDELALRNRIPCLRERKLCRCRVFFNSWLPLRGRSRIHSRMEYVWLVTTPARTPFIIRYIYIEKRKRGTLLYCVR